MEPLTISDAQLVLSGSHGLIVVPQSKFAKCWQPCCPHPDLELFVLCQVRDRICVGVSIWKSFDPIRRGHDLVIRVFCLCIKIGITAPCNALVRHLVCLSINIAAVGWIQGKWASDSVIEQRVGYQTTGIVSFSIRRQLDWIAGAATDCAIGDVLSIQLASVERLDISSVILIEAGELVVEENRRTDIVRDVELQCTDANVFLCHAKLRRVVAKVIFPLWWLSALGLEGRGVLVAGYGVKGVGR